MTRKWHSLVFLDAILSNVGPATMNFRPFIDPSFDANSYANGVITGEASVPAALTELDRGIVSGAPTPTGAAIYLC